MIDINKILDIAIAKDASDVHLIYRNKPMIRIARRLEPLEGFTELQESDMTDIYDYLVKGNIDADETYR